MKRLAELDILRGVRLLMMVVNHSPSSLRRFTDQPVGFFTTAEAFVSVSAFLAGMLFRKRMEKDGFDAARSSNTQQSVVDTPPSAQNPPPAPNAYARQSMVSSGIIKALTYAPRGEIDGAVLDNGTIVHVPPPVGIQYASLFRIGAPLAASGYGTANGYGRSFEATLIGPSAGQMRPVAAAGYGPRDGSPGLVNMSERARFIHGRLSVESHAGKGTRVEVRAPIAAADDLY
jgi:hypothetical protein